MNIGDRFKNGDASFDAVEYPVGGGLQSGGALVTSLRDRDFARVKRRVYLFAFFRELHNEVVEFGELPLEFFDLYHDFRQVLVAFFRRITDIQIVDDRLAEQFDL